MLTTDNCKINQNAPTLREVHKFSVSVTLKWTFSNRCTSWQLATHRAGLQDFITVSIPRKSPEACGVLWCKPIHLKFKSNTHERIALYSIYLKRRGNGVSSVSSRRWEPPMAQYKLVRYELKDEYNIIRTAHPKIQQSPRNSSARKITAQQ